jgi:hypothetical protein
VIAPAVGGVPIGDVGRGHRVGGRPSGREPICAPSARNFQACRGARSRRSAPNC